MKERIPDSLVKLAQNNSKTLERHNIIRSRIISNFENTQKAGETYLKNEFDSNRIDSTPDGNMTRLGLSDVEKGKREILKDILQFDPAMIIVRPEMYHAADKICDFLLSNEFKIHYTDDKQISVKEYFQLYKEVIRNVSALKPALPSRTMTYINAPSKIIILTDPKNRFAQSNQGLADGFFNTFKGKEGRLEKNTIRGEVVFNEAVKLGFNTLDNPAVSQAVDPFGAYSQIIKQPGTKWYHLKAEKEYYALMYNAQGIHFPNNKELPRDIATIYSPEKLLDILESLI